MTRLLTYESKQDASSERTRDRKEKAKPIREKVTRLSKIFCDWQNMEVEQSKSLIEMAEKARDDIGKKIESVVAEVVGSSEGSS